MQNIEKQHVSLIIIHSAAVLFGWNIDPRLWAASYIEWTHMRAWVVAKSVIHEHRSGHIIC